MARFVALYRKPDDVESFEEYYRTTHLPIARSWPGVQAIRVTRFSATARGTEAEYHLLFEADFATDEEMAAALRSDPGKAAGRDVAAMQERFGVSPTMLVGGDF